MASYRKILAAYDGSQSADNALMQSFTLAGQQRGALEVLTVYPRVDAEYGSMEMEEALRANALETLRKGISLTMAYHVSADKRLTEGPVIDALIDVADEDHCDLVAIGRRRVGMFNHLLTGSASGALTKRCHADVMVVPDESKLRTDRVLVAVDGTAEGRKALRKAIAFCQEFGSNLIVLSIAVYDNELIALDPQEVKLRDVRAREYALEAVDEAAKKGIKAQAVVLQDDHPAEAIADAASKYDAGAVFVGTHSRGTLGRLVYGSVASGVVSHAECPVFVVRN